jgi:hypothetical protein
MFKGASSHRVCPHFFAHTRMQLVDDHGRHGSCTPIFPRTQVQVMGSRHSYSLFGLRLRSSQKLQELDAGLLILSSQSRSIRRVAPSCIIRGGGGKRTPPKGAVRILFRLLSKDTPTSFERLCSRSVPQLPAGFRHPYQCHASTDPQTDENN